MTLTNRLNMISKTLYQQTLSDCTTEQAYYTVLTYCKEALEDRAYISGDRKLYYFSAEFLIGKLLSNNLINLGIYDEMAEALKECGHLLSDIEEIESEPSLGNGGLGRLAACFLDSIATLNLQGDGIGLNYHLGLFKQTFKDMKQYEIPNEWIDPINWLNKTDKHYTVDYKDFSLTSTLYDIDVIGYHGNKNRLHLFDLDSVDDTVVKDGISYDLSKIKDNLTLFLYPDDSTEEGKKLRLYQQYFMVACGAQYILDELKDSGHSIKDLDQFVAIQINDTHPSLIIPELIRLMMNDGLTLKESIRVITRTCAYTNHTILAEALEKWPISYLEEVVPQLVPIIQALDAVANERSNDMKTAIIDDEQFVHMAHMDIHFSHSTNGVAAIHTDILKNVELKSFYDLYPDNFNNKTNGITFRRWLLSCNHELSAYIDSLIGTHYHLEASELERLLEVSDLDELGQQLIAIKAIKKQQLCDYIKQHAGIELDPQSIFDVQVKRLHEYKRQQMNVLSIIHLYQAIKAGRLPAHPVTCIFGAKAAPAYIRAKDIIHLVLCLQTLINNDPGVSPYLNVVMLENYNVTYAEHVIPAADLSEQISLASKEASGTGNMKFMLNGAITIGTDDGANVEIHDLVGDDAIYIFGMSSDDVISHYEDNDYDPSTMMADPFVKEIVDFIISDELCAIGDKDALQRVYDELTTKDTFMALLDLGDYIKAKNQAIEDYTHTTKWAKKMLVNIAKAGFFSSDRTIEQYNEDIWQL